MRNIRIVVFAVIGMLIFILPALSGVPRLINYQGILTDDTGTPLDDTYNLTFTVYDDSTIGATVLWTELHTDILVNDGFFNLILGSMSTLPDTVFNNYDECWMGITVNADPEMTPRMQITSVPWAFRAAVADTVLSGGGGAGDGHSLDAVDGDPVDAVYVDNDGHVGIGTASPNAPLQIVGGSTVLFGVDTLGAGSKLMWLPSKSAFRGGGVLNTEWDWANIGDYSTAMGYGTEASNYGSTAMGNNTTASGYASTAMGSGTTASGNRSTALGGNTTASNNRSTALGDCTTASGVYSTAMGSGTKALGGSSTALGVETTAESYVSTAIGRYNIGGGNPNSWIDTDPLFEIGNGTSIVNTDNAMTILKNGKVGIGTATPTHGLEVADTVQMSGFKMPPGASTGYVLTSDAVGVGSWQSLSEVSDGDWQISGNDMYSNVPGNVGVGITSPIAPLHVASGKTVLFGADTLGAGSKLMWLPSKSAFRVGEVGMGGDNYWNWANIGDYSIAMGFSAMASAPYSTAMGLFTNASGNVSTAMGRETYAVGAYSTTAGFSTTASGEVSTAMGIFTKAESQFSMAIGRYNVGGGTPDSWVDTDPLFEIGNGSFNNPTNAVTVLKNGNVGIGTITPAYKLDVADTVQTSSFKMPPGASNGYVLTSDPAGIGSWQSPSAVPDGDWQISGDDMYSNVSGNVGIGTASPIAPLHVAGGSTVLFGVDTQGAGSKLMWHPTKSAFRAGNVNSSQWDWASIGGNSTAMGYNTTASGQNSTAMGYNTTASGDGSTAMGDNTTASGWASTALGQNTTASGQNSTAMGSSATASGYLSTAIGNWTKAESHSSMAIGRYNIGGGNPNSWIDTDPLFEIGKGTSNAPEDRSNAMTVRKNGNVEIGADLVVDGAYRGDIGPNNGAPFPRPAYDSGWVGISQGQMIPLTHNIGGNVDNYVVDFSCYSTMDKINNYALGGDLPSGSGAYYYDLDNSQIKVVRLSSDTTAQAVRVRIWVYN